MRNNRVSSSTLLKQIKYEKTINRSGYNRVTIIVLKK